MTDKRITARYAFLCDDFRQEKNGKYIFIGVYSDSISVNGFPATLVLSLVPYFESAAVGTYETEFEIKYNDKTLAKAIGRVNSQSNGGAFTPFQMHPLELQASGVLSVRFKEKGKRWKTLLTMPVGTFEDTDSST